LDVATGTGLFSVRLADQGFCVLGLDANPHMLAQAIHKAKQQACPFHGIVGLAEQLPLAERSVSVMFSTNAIHHFDLQAHFTQVQRVLRAGGCYVVYTRFQKHNARSIWGQLFPHFAEKETRLYNPEDFEQLEREFPKLALESLGELSFEKSFSLDRLLQTARQRKYSTFSLYGDEEFGRAYATFRSRLRHWSESSYLSEIGRIVFRRR
jgi:ubiquinone/menaquinone biosynthesis C-methylase UbiE